MTHAIIALKDCNEITAAKGDLLILNDKSFEELNLKSLILEGFFKELSEDEAFKIYKKQ